MIKYEDERIKVVDNVIEVKKGTSIIEAMNLYPQYFSMLPKGSKREDLELKNAREDFFKHDYLLETPKAF